MSGLACATRGVSMVARPARPTRTAGFLFDSIQTHLRTTAAIHPKVPMIIAAKKPKAECLLVQMLLRLSSFEVYVPLQLTY